MKIITMIVYFAFACLALSPIARAVSPPPDGGYPGGNTAEGQNALLSLTSGTYNTASGFLSLGSNAAGNFNTGVGAGTLFANTAEENTATGAAALFSNTSGVQNTANGAFALFTNTTGSFNTATGFQALFNNTANGNTANGVNALASNSIGTFNTATGTGALFNNTTGSNNTATGDDALLNNTTGSSNIAMGNGAGSNLTTGDLNIDIGAFGIAGESSTIRIGRNADQTRTFIAGITGVAVTGASVVVDGSGQLGVAPSSMRFKEEIRPMDKASEAILALRPVTFRYKKGIDPQAIPQFGLVAEEVEKVNPDLVVRDKEGTPYSVRYEQVNAMLLNEFLKEHERVQELNAVVVKQGVAIERQRKDFEAATAQQRNDFRAIAAEHEKAIRILIATVRKQASQIQKVSARLEVDEPRSQMVLKDP